MGLVKIVGHGWYEIKFSCLFYSLTECDKTPSLLDCGKRLISFPAVTEYFVKMNQLPEKSPTYLNFLCTIERFIIILYGRTSKHIHEHIHG